MSCSFALLSCMFETCLLMKSTIALLCLKNAVCCTDVLCISPFSAASLGTSACGKMVQDVLVRNRFLENRADQLFVSGAFASLLSSICSVELAANCSVRHGARSLVSARLFIVSILESIQWSVSAELSWAPCDQTSIDSAMQDAVHQNCHTTR